ncbi:hypothetical protein B0H17DRAFT_1210797 [Mycena rosella]|uniref:Uncharacterized protein n=1 Tax=Mycena rosella TaxID=1033263 RepID=A0AAD7CVG3_MYCRO|nr:hypothetical protein B0H17DRAFT_1210797 [Mycena rosella]
MLLLPSTLPRRSSAGVSKRAHLPFNLNMYSRCRTIARRLVHNELPLGALRLVFMVLALVFSIVTGALCVKIWTKHHHSQKVLDANLPSGVSAVLGYHDVKTTSILLFVANNLVTFAVSHIVMAMLQDLFHIIPPFVLRRLNMKLPQQPISSVTLPHQAAALLVSTACFVVAAVFHTMFVFTRSGTLTVHDGAGEAPAATAAVQAVLDRLGISTRYREVQYIRISAEMPWPTVFFILGVNIVTLAAWYQFRHAPASTPTLEDSRLESVEVERASDLGDSKEEKASEMIAV